MVVVDAVDVLSSDVPPYQGPWWTTLAHFPRLLADISQVLRYFFLISDLGSQTLILDIYQPLRFLMRNEMQEIVSEYSVNKYESASLTNICSIFRQTSPYHIIIYHIWYMCYEHRKKIESLLCFVWGPRLCLLNGSKMIWRFFTGITFQNVVVTGSYHCYR